MEAKMPMKKPHIPPSTMIGPHQKRTRIIYGERKEGQVNSNIWGTHKIPQKRLFSPLTTRILTLRLPYCLYL